MRIELRSRQLALALFCLGYAVLGVNISSVLVFGPLLIRELDPGSADLLVGLLFALPSLTGFLGYNFWGAMYDRYPRPYPFVALPLLAEAGFLSLVLAFPSAVGLVCLSTAFSFFTTALFPATKAWSTLAWEDSKGRIVGFLHAAESFGWGLGSLLGAAICWGTPDTIQAIRGIFWVCWGCTVATALVMLFAFPRVQAGPAQQRGAKAFFGELKSLYSSRPVLRLALFLFVLTMSNVAFFSYYSLYLCQHLKGSPMLLSLSLAGATVGGALLFPVYGRLADRWGRRPLLQAGTVAYLAFYGGLCFVHSPLLTAVLYTIPIYPAIRVATTAWLADLTREGNRAGGMGLLEGVGALASVAGPFLGWATVSAFGFGALPLAAVTLMSVGILCFLSLGAAPREALPA
jgi:predicted MFS family arabinose efflux permease